MRNERIHELGHTQEAPAVGTAAPITADGYGPKRAAIQARLLPIPDRDQHNLVPGNLIAVGDHLRHQSHGWWVTAAFPRVTGEGAHVHGLRLDWDGNTAAGDPAWGRAGSRSISLVVYRAEEGYALEHTQALVARPRADEAAWQRHCNGLTNPSLGHDDRRWSLLPSGALVPTMTLDQFKDIHKDFRSECGESILTMGPLGNGTMLSGYRLVNQDGSPLKDSLWMYHGEPCQQPVRFVGVDHPRALRFVYADTETKAIIIQYPGLLPGQKEDAQVGGRGIPVPAALRPCIAPVGRMTPERLVDVATYFTTSDPATAGTGTAYGIHPAVLTAGARRALATIAPGYAASILGVSRYDEIDAAIGGILEGRRSCPVDLASWAMRVDQAKQS